MEGLRLSKKGPSSAFAGEGERLPGMGVRPADLIGGAFPEAWRASRIWKDTWDVSQESNPSSWEGRLDGPSEEDWRECFTL